MYEGGTNVQEMSGTYKNKHFKIMNNYIPSKKNPFQKSIFPGEHTNSYLEKKRIHGYAKKSQTHKHLNKLNSLPNRNLETNHEDNGQNNTRRCRNKQYKSMIPMQHAKKNDTKCTKNNKR